MEERDRLDVSKISLISERFIRWKVSESLRKIRISYVFREREREKIDIFDPNRRQTLN